MKIEHDEKNCERCQEHIWSSWEIKDKLVAIALAMAIIVIAEKVASWIK